MAREPDSEGGGLAAARPESELGGNFVMSSSTGQFCAASPRMLPPALWGRQDRGLSHCSDKEGEARRWAKPSTPSLPCFHFYMYLGLSFSGLPPASGHCPGPLSRKGQSWALDSQVIGARGPAPVPLWPQMPSLKGSLLAGHSGKGLGTVPGHSLVAVTLDPVPLITAQLRRPTWTAPPLRAEEGGPEPGTGPDHASLRPAEKGAPRGSIPDRDLPSFVLAGAVSGTLNLGTGSEPPSRCPGGPSRDLGQSTVKNKNN